MKKIIALYGGTFDPPHLAHQEIVNRLLSLDIDKILLLPTRSIWKNIALLSFQEKIYLLGKIFGDEPRIELSLLVARPVPSIRTITRLRYVCPHDDLWICMGEDNLRSFHLWVDFMSIVDRVDKIVIFSRIDDRMSCEPLLDRRVEHLVRESGKFDFVKMSLPISSSEVRLLLEAREFSALENRQLLDERILGFLKKKYG